MQLWRARNSPLPCYFWHLLVSYANTPCAAAQHPKTEMASKYIHPQGTQMSHRNQEMAFSTLKGTSGRLHPVAQILYPQYHGMSLLEGLSRIISISPLNPTHTMLRTPLRFLRLYISFQKKEGGGEIKLLLSFFRLQLIWNKI